MSEPVKRPPIPILVVIVSLFGVAVWVAPELVDYARQESFLGWVWWALVLIETRL